mgnify:CR=1 FL=1
MSATTIHEFVFLLINAGSGDGENDFPVVVGKNPPRPRCQWFTQAGLNKFEKQRCEQKKVDLKIDIDRRRESLHRSDGLWSRRS